MATVQATIMNWIRILSWIRIMKLKIHSIKKLFTEVFLKGASTIPRVRNTTISKKRQRIPVLQRFIFSWRQKDK